VGRTAIVDGRKIIHRNRLNYRTWQLQRVPGITLFLRNTKQYIHFFQNSLPVQLYTSVSDCKGVGNISGSHFVKAFSAFPSHA